MPQGSNRSLFWSGIATSPQDTVPSECSGRIIVFIRSSKTMEENQKLINWIMKILDTVGTMEVREKSSFKIPVYENKNYRAYEQNYMGIYEKERLTIPEITIVKMG